uniref:Uncharacterized protein n=1 Tax=Rhizophora mucronata TaxID=61149 RepID=A0A2P2MYM7_RHIMU
MHKTTHNAVHTIVQ